MVISALTAVLLSVLFMFLSLRVIKARHKHRVAIGDGGVEELHRLIRAQSNFAEYVPITLILLILAEMNGAPFFLLILAAFALVSGRLFHAYGVSKVSENLQIRVRGMQLTFAAILLSALAVLYGLVIPLVTS